MVCKTLKYTEHLPILALEVTGCVSISSFASLVGIPVDIVSSAWAIKFCVGTAEIKKDKSVIGNSKILIR